MKTVTVTNIHLGPYIKWSVIANFIVGTLTGLSQAVIGYVRTGDNLTGYLLWYGAGLSLLYIIVGLAGGILFVFLYNSFYRSIGGYVIEVTEQTTNDSTPPPPPDLTAK